MLSGLILIGRKFDQRSVKGRVKNRSSKLLFSFEGLEGEPENREIR